MWETFVCNEIIGKYTFPKLKWNPEYTNHKPELNRDKIKIEAYLKIYCGDEIGKIHFFGQICDS